MRIELSGITKHYESQAALDGIDLEFGDGELTAVLGPSGCGKSTMLNVIAGILHPDSGTVRFDDRDVTDTPPQERGLGFVFQNYALYPHLTVRENIGFPLRFGPERRRFDRRERTLELARLVRVEALLDRHPSELSGGARSCAVCSARPA